MEDEKKKPDLEFEDVPPGSPLVRSLLTIAKKEQILNEIIVWLKAKGLWEECKAALSIHIVSKEESHGKDR